VVGQRGSYAERQEKGEKDSIAIATYEMLAYSTNFQIKFCLDFCVSFKMKRVKLKRSWLSYNSFFWCCNLP